MLSEIQKAIIKRSSIRIILPDGEIDILKGRIVNAEKGDKYGEEALLELINSKGEWRIEPLEHTPPTTITEGWLILKDRIFPSKGYNENFSLLFSKLDFDREELFKFMNWVKNTRFTGFLVSTGGLLAFSEGEPMYARALVQGSVYTGSDAFLHLVNYAGELDVYIASQSAVMVFSSAMLNPSTMEPSEIQRMRLRFAEEGESGIIITHERLEIFDDGLRIVNSTDTSFTTRAFPDIEGKAIVGIAGQEPRPIRAMLISTEDIKLLQDIYDRSLKILGGKIGKEMLESIIEENENTRKDPDRMIATMRTMLERAKDIGGKAWLKKHRDELTDGIEQIKNEELRKKLEKLFEGI